MQVDRTGPTAEIAAVAARLVVEEGLEYATAKRHAGKQLGLSSRGLWPDNATLDAAVREHIAIFAPTPRRSSCRCCGGRPWSGWTGWRISDRI
ncbi:hypothetical protein Y695_02752 [Hydrogenophaga sp. T4]|nr:hypothetical protein Y695_02752 [Hydrogenophaga sp. T4]